MSHPRGGGPRYSKPLVVPDDLRLLAGPTFGIVHLPVHLDWSGRADYDLDRPGRIVDLYRTVINEAAEPTDLHTYLDAATLKRLWSYMWLPIGIRRVWETRFPELAQRSPEPPRDSCRRGAPIGRREDLAHIQCLQMSPHTLGELPGIGCSQRLRQ